MMFERREEVNVTTLSIYCQICGDVYGPWLHKDGMRVCEDCDQADYPTSGYEAETRALEG